jgi:antitoxin (DNA-binding transcriptional repressor) of toxin-antitoxin stability system
MWIGEISKVVNMTTVAMEQAQDSLPQLIDVVALGEHVLITRDQVPVAELVPVSRPAPKPTFGSAKGLIKSSEDFDAPVEDFREYME